ncbi:hypothetical protein, partial [Emergencia timonensis]|uniref:hypothetical protein n=1 Tax=Emergencia timonensis TaxID=1776384 RepID=UPI00266BB480
MTKFKKRKRIVRKSEITESKIPISLCPSFAMTTAKVDFLDTPAACCLRMKKSQIMESKIPISLCPSFAMTTAK